jgi:centromeric protein E
MRPLNAKEGHEKCVWKVLPEENSVTQTTGGGEPLTGAERVTGRTFFTFDQTFGVDESTAHVYDAVAKDIVYSAIAGLNGTIFAYGQTSSGKTFTMQGSGTIAEGSVTENGGIVHLAAADIFEHIRNTPDRVFSVSASFLEIYNEEVRDLLSPDTKTLQIREDPRRGVFVQSEKEFVTDFDSLLALLYKGEKSRQIASTAMNERSSRSHTIFRITIESRANAENGATEEENTIENGNGAVLISTLNLVDLAGSESVRYTGATGKRQKEGGMINQRYVLAGRERVITVNVYAPVSHCKFTYVRFTSLLALSGVIAALGDSRQTYVNYRDSKLTRILQPSLSGNARMSFVCCISPSALYTDETRSTLQFASRAKLVKVQAQVNEVLDKRSIIHRLQEELAEVRRKNGDDERDRLLNELQESKEKVAELERNLQDTDDRLTAAAKQRDETFVQLESTQASLDTAQGELKTLRSELEGSRKQNVSFGSEMKMLLQERDVQSIKIAETEKSLETMKETLRDSENTKESLQISLQETEAKVSLQASTIKDLEVSMQERQSQLAGAQLALDVTMQKLNATENECVAANDRIAQLKPSRETTKNVADLSSQGSQVALKAAISAGNDLEAQGEMPPSTLEETRSELARLQDELTAADKMIGEYTLDAACNEEVVKKLSMEKLELSRQLEELNERLSEKECGRKHALDELEEFKHEKGALQSKHDELVEAFRLLQSEKDASRLLLEEQSVELSRTTLSLKGAVKEKHQLELDLVKHREELQTLESEKSDAVRESDILKEDIARLKTEMSRAEGNIKEKEAVVEDLKTCLSGKDKIVKDLSNENFTLKNELEESLMRVKVQETQLEEQCEEYNELFTSYLDLQFDQQQRQGR